MTDDTEADPEELLQQSKEQSRHTSEPTRSAESSDATPGRTEAIKDALLAVEAGDQPENINIRDARLKALLVGLEDAEELDAVATELAGILDADTPEDGVTQSDVARLLMRVGLQEGTPDLLAEATDARQQAVLEQASDF
jgi:hypothetical protein